MESLEEELKKYLEGLDDLCQLDYKQLNKKIDLSRYCSKLSSLILTGDAESEPERKYFYYMRACGIFIEFLPKHPKFKKENPLVKSLSPVNVPFLCFLL